jgi:mRNA-degrading endonuclease YafQ of YafQ-DinJ toxin-antitoxin module
LFAVKFTRECERQFKQEKKLDKFSENDLINILAWIYEMSEFAPNYIKNSKYWRDHTLSGDRWGQKASSFSAKGRIIYKIALSSREVLILKISSDHTY